MEGVLLFILGVAALGVFLVGLLRIEEVLTKIYVEHCAMTEGQIRIARELRRIRKGKK